MLTMLFILLILLVSFPFITGMGAKPGAIAPTVETTEAEATTKEVAGLATGVQRITPLHEYGNVIMKRYSGEGQPVCAVILAQNSVCLQGISS